MERSIEDLRRQLDSGDVDAARRIYRVGARHADDAMMRRALEILHAHRSREQPIRVEPLDPLRTTGDPGLDGLPPGGFRVDVSVEPAARISQAVPVRVRLAMDASASVLLTVRSDGRAGWLQALHGDGARRALAPLEMPCEGLLSHPMAPFVVAWGRSEGVLYHRGIDVRTGRLMPRFGVEGGRHMAMGAAGAAWIVVERRVRQRLVPCVERDEPDGDDHGHARRARHGASSACWTHDVWEVPNVLRPARRLAAGAVLSGAWRGVEISPDARWLYEPDARSDRDVRLWSTSSDHVVYLPTAGHFVDRVAVVHEDRRALVVDHRGTRSRMRLFELPDATQVMSVSFDGILRPAVVSGGDHLLGLCLGRLHVWSTRDLEAEPRQIPAPGRTLRVQHEIVCDDEARVVAIADGCSLQTTDLERLARPLEIPGYGGRISSARLADTAACLLVEDAHRVTLVDLEAAARGELHVRCLVDDFARKRAFSLTPDARRLLWCQSDDQGPRLALLDLGAAPMATVARAPAPRLVPLLRPVAASAIHPAGDCFAVATHPGDTEVEIFSWRGLTRVGHFEVANRVYCLEFSPCGRWLALAAGSGELQVWELTHPGGPRRLGSGHASMHGMYDVVQTIGFDAAGVMFATLRGAVHRIESDGRFVPEWVAQLEDDARAIVFSPGGRYMAQRARMSRVQIEDLGHARAAAGSVLVGLPDALTLTGAGQLLELELSHRRLVVHALPDLEDPTPPAAGIELEPMAPRRCWSRLGRDSLPPGLDGDAAQIYRELEKRFVRLGGSGIATRGAGVQTTLHGLQRLGVERELLPRAARMLEAMHNMQRLVAAADLKEAMRQLHGTDETTEPDFPGPRREATAELVNREPMCVLQRRVQPRDLSYDPTELELLHTLTGDELFTNRGHERVRELAEQVAFERAVLDLRNSVPVGCGILQLTHALRGLAVTTSLCAVVILSSVAMVRPDPTPVLRLIADERTGLDQRAAAVSCMSGLGYDTSTLQRVVALTRSYPGVLAAAERLWTRTRRHARLAGLLPL